jgi:hypothetical protein
VTVYGVTLIVTGALLSLLWRYALHVRLVRPDSTDEEVTLLTHRLTPGLAGYALLILVGLFFPVVALFGYLLVALFFIIPLPVPLAAQLTAALSRGRAAAPSSARSSAAERIPQSGSLRVAVNEDERHSLPVRALACSEEPVRRLIVPLRMTPDRTRFPPGRP